MPLPTDPRFVEQWHLDNSTPGLLDLNVVGVWNPDEGRSYSGAGTVTVVIDDAFDYSHPDFGGYDQQADYNFANDNDDPFGISDQAHGTAVAGIIGADADGTGGVGVAFDTTLVGHQVINLLTNDWLTTVSLAIGRATDIRADVVNISQGIANDYFSEFGNGYEPQRFVAVEEAITGAVTEGRGGLGMTIIKSAGNSRAEKYDVNADDWTNDTRQVVVAAVDQDGFVSTYSSYGAAILVSAFGTPGEVVTTDRVGADGYNEGDFTQTFSGTSAAAPMVAGVVALMYEADPGLGWRDVQSILAASARHVGSAVGGPQSGFESDPWQFNAATTWNGGGQHFSNDYGYGLVDALAAVRMAETWLMTGRSAKTSANEVTKTINLLDRSTPIPDADQTGLAFSGQFAPGLVVERVTVSMTFATFYVGDMQVYLQSPHGTISVLADRTGDRNDVNGTWTFESQAFRGERSTDLFDAGEWKVTVIDTATGDVLTVSKIDINLFGTDSVNDRYIYTNAFSDYAEVSGHFREKADTNGGIDTVNAAAVTLASDIRLDGGVGSIDGIVVRFFDIENAIGGDGNDTLTGNGVSNQLFGMRGADIVSGGGGGDSLFGSTGADTLMGDSGTDILTGGDGADLVGGGDGKDLLFGGAGQDVFLFSAALSRAAPDRVQDFVRAADDIHLDRDVFARLGGAVVQTEIRFGKAAQDGNDFLVYHRATGTLMYDANGGRAGGAIVFAKFDPGTRLTFGDFDMV